MTLPTASYRALSAAIVLAAGLAIGCDNDDSDDNDDGAGETAEPVDTDGDGISDDDEAELGTDANNSDSDGDGISDSEELDLGTDPLSDDTDGDGYLDNWEITEETDPNDADSVIYTGGWPYNPNKDDLGESDSERARAGEQAPRYQLEDQHGDIVDLYDFAGQDKLIILDLSADWCGYCKELSKMISGQRNYFDQFSDEYAWIEGIEETIGAGEIYWVTVIDGDSSGRTPTSSTIVNWDNRYTVEQVPVLLDDSGALEDWFRSSSRPQMALLDENMEVIQSGNYFSVLTTAYELANE